MKQVISVRFKDNGKSYYFDPAGADLAKGDYVIVETARGVECGEVVSPVRQLPESAPAQGPETHHPGGRQRGCAPDAPEPGG